MEFNDVIKNRIAVRKFSSKKVERDKITQILEAGRLAPTAKNNQPQKILVVTEEENLKKIDEITPCRYNAPVSLIICSSKSIAWSKDDYSSLEMDASIVTTHMMLEATNIGVDSIWVMMFDKDLVRDRFNLENDLFPICMLQLGYRADDYVGSAMHNNRKNLDETVIYL